MLLNLSNIETLRDLSIYIVILPNGIIYHFGSFGFKYYNRYIIGTLVGTFNKNIQQPRDTDKYASKSRRV